MISIKTLATAAAVTIILSACAGYGDAPAGPNSGRRAEEVLAPRYVPINPRAPRHQDALREGIKLYEEGDFNGAIRRLASVDAPSESMANRLSALKYTAFSYCVTSRPVPCRQSFDKAFLLDPNFDLAAGEHSHPLWGPVFARAKKDR
jgi:hypothetical protein